MDASGIHVVFGSIDEERSGLMHLVKPSEVQIAAIHYVEVTGVTSAANQALAEADIPSLARLFSKFSPDHARDKAQTR